MTHHYSPNYQAMGDCNVCGLQRDDNPEHEKAYTMNAPEMTREEIEATAAANAYKSIPQRRAARAITQLLRQLDAADAKILDLRNSENMENE